MAADKNMIIAFVPTGVLGLLSVVLGIAAEATRIRASDVYEESHTCYYPSSPAFGCAIVAALLLIVAQINITVFSGCCGCCKKDPTAPAVTGTNRTLAIIFGAVSWIAFAISIVLFILGAARNGTGNQTNYDSCYVLKPGVFATGAIFSLLTVSLSIAAYILSKPSNVDPNNQNNANIGISMGVPQFSPGHGGVQYMPPSNRDAQYPPPGTGGVPYPPPGTGGVPYPPPGIGGVQYTSSTDIPPLPGRSRYNTPAPGSKSSF